MKERINKMAAKKEQEMIIKINRPQITKANITIVGETPLIVHAWGEKAKKEMLDAQQKKKVDKKAKDIRDPFSEFMDALYWITPKPKEKTPEAFEKAVMEGAKFGFPITAIKQAALSACYRAGIIPNQMGMKCTFYLNAQEGMNPGTGSELAVIDTDEPPVFREDMVKIGGMTKVADLRYRPAFNNWKIRLTISLIEVGTFNMESIINAIDMGGFMNGIGEWRMERDGEFGRFHVEVEGK
jgi:hypothetical protein